MTTTQTPSSSADLAVTQVLAALLERLDRSAVPVGAEQYRAVVSHLIEAFGAAQLGAELGLCWTVTRRRPNCTKMSITSTRACAAHRSTVR